MSTDKLKNRLTALHSRFIQSCKKRFGAYVGEDAAQIAALKVLDKARSGSFTYISDGKLYRWLIMAASWAIKNENRVGRLKRLDGARVIVADSELLSPDADDDGLVTRHEDSEVDPCKVHENREQAEVIQKAISEIANYLSAKDKSGLQSIMFKFMCDFKGVSAFVLSEEASPAVVDETFRSHMKEYVVKRVLSIGGANLPEDKISIKYQTLYQLIDRLSETLPACKVFKVATGQSLHSLWYSNGRGGSAPRNNARGDS